MMIDLDVARKNIPGGESGLQHMAKLMKSESARLIGEMRDSLARLDTESFQRAAHTLKSAAAIFGIEPIVARARALEAAGKSGDIADAQPQVDELAELAERLEVELDAVIG